ncbi:hypothetical protein KKH23_05665 [Patescibacteria group bacterium]|nr:hypothetical protein [Patescibacteria group bacterium]
MSAMVKGRRSITEVIGSDRIKKTYREAYMEDLPREVRALQRLGKYDHFPKLLERGRDYVIVSYVGRRVRKEDRGRYRGQALEILRELEEAGIEHRDGWKDHWREMDGRLYLIDFGACSFRGERNPGVRKFKQRGTDREWVDRLFK